MNYLEFLQQSAEERKTILCFGMDPVVEKMPRTIAGKNEEKIFGFFTKIVDAAIEEKGTISALKPNYAFYAQYGFEGLRALKSIIEHYKGKIPIILDAKRGDVGKSSAAYAKEAFNFWGADAVTLSPYMGHDSLEPFFEFCKKGKGAYVLCRTSNKGAQDFQEIMTEMKKKLYLEVTKKIIDWHTPGVGVVAGATALDELEEMMWEFYDAKKPSPFLVPGVGAQGASAGETAKALKTVWSEPFHLHRINSSSGISYAYLEEDTEDYEEAAIRKMKEISREIAQA